MDVDASGLLAGGLVEVCAVVVATGALAAAGIVEVEAGNETGAGKPASFSAMVLLDGSAFEVLGAPFLGVVAFTFFFTGRAGLAGALAGWPFGET